MGGGLTYMAELAGESIVVTGGSRGLGKEMALRFSEEGAVVTIVSRSEDSLRSVAEEAPGEVIVAPADVRDPAAVEAAVKKTVDRVGSVNTLVNNAGVGLLSLADQTKPLVDITVEEWGTIMETNLEGVFLFTKEVLPLMQSTGRGNVINISSGLGRRAAPGWTPYITTKWGLEGLTRALALEVQDDGILVNGLDPGGPVKTRFWNTADDSVDLLEPTVMNDAAVLLAAQGPSGVTGESMSAADWEARLE